MRPYSCQRRTARNSFRLPVDCAFINSTSIACYSPIENNTAARKFKCSIAAEPWLSQTRKRKQSARMGLDIPDPSAWEQLWERGIAPGEYFDREAPSPALVELLSGGTLASGGAALVPGCGRGYEVLAIAASGIFDAVVGLDLAPTGIEAAKAYAAGKPGAEKVEYRCEDFFSYQGIKGGFRFVFDYTFLCALPPELREDWARKNAELIAPDGVLVTLMFPLGKPLSDGGPPYGLSFATYEELLGKVGFQAVQGPRILPDELCHHDRGSGGSGIALWKRLGQF
jgi:methyl halide transferase